MQCPDCSAALAQYGSDFTKCNICGFEMGPNSTRRGRPLIAADQNQVPAKITKKATNQARYRSLLKKQIRTAFIILGNVSDIDLCRWLDNEGCEPPSNLTKGMLSDRYFEAAYRDSRFRGKMATMFSKVRADMRKDGVL